MNHESHASDLKMIKLGLQKLLDIEKMIDYLSYDENIEKLVKQFQSKYNLNVDGVFGNKCWAIMKSFIIITIKINLFQFFFLINDRGS